MGECQVKQPIPQWNILEKYYIPICDNPLWPGWRTYDQNAPQIVSFKTLHYVSYLDHLNLALFNLYVINLSLLDINLLV